MRSVKNPYQGQPALEPAERERLLLEHLPQVQYIARRIHERLPRHVELEDLIHTGVLGLVEALHRYDPAKDVQFGSYAKHRVRGAILDSLRKLDWAPRELRKKARAMEDACRRVQSRLGRIATDQEVASEMGIDAEKLEQLVRDLQGLQVGCLRDVSGEESEEHRGSRNFLGTSEQDPFAECARSELRDLLAIALSELPERDRQVMALYYFEELTLKEVGAVIGVNESRVSQIHTAVTMKLRARMRELLAMRPQERPAPPPLPATPIPRGQTVLEAK